MNAPHPSPPITMPAPAQAVVGALAEAGYECFAVGGCVRDCLLGRPPQDWDFTTNATTAAMKAAFDTAGLRWVATGETHGTLTVLVGDESFEVTTYRVDGVYTDGRHPDTVTFTSDLTEDLARRDFTINAMAAAADGTLVDPFGGQADLAAGLIRAVGDPIRRFTEDALRILRGVRFAATLGFAVDGPTAAAMAAKADTLDLLSRERVYGELSRLLAAEDGADLAATLAEFAPLISRAIFGDRAPELDGRTIESLAFTANDEALRWALVLAAADTADAAPTLRGLRAPKQLTEEVSAVLALKDVPLPTDRVTLRRLVVACGSVERFQRLIAFHRARAHVFETDPAPTLAQLDTLVANAQRELEAGLPLTVAELAITGGDLIEQDMTPGPAVGQSLQRLFTAVVDGRLANDPATLMTALTTLEDQP